MQHPNWKKNTIIFMLSQAISLFGSSLVQYAITWHITLTTQSGIYMTISIICGFVPTLLLSPFAGVWADRYDRKKLVMLSDGLIALSTLALAIVFLMGYQAIWLLFVVSAIRSLGSAVQAPAINALLPDMVPEDQLMRVNGINGSVQSLLMLVSPALAASLLTMIGSLELIFFIDVVTAAIAIFVMFAFLQLPSRAKPVSEQTGYLSEIKEGIAYIRKEKYLARLFLLCTILYISFAPVSFLTPLQVVRSYGEDVWMLTAIEIAFSAGMLVGGLLISVWGGFKNRIYTVGVSLIVVGVLTALLGFGIPFWVYLALMALIGIGLPFFNTPAVALLQERVDNAYLGRVFSVMSMISSAMMPLGMLIFGPLADRISIEAMLIATGAVMLVMAAAMMGDKTIMAAGVPRADTETPS